MDELEMLLNIAGIGHSRAPNGIFIRQHLVVGVGYYPYGSLSLWETSHGWKRVDNSTDPAIIFQAILERI